MNINDALKRAIYHHNENRISEAEALYRSVLEFDINHPIASVLLAKILLQTGRPVSYTHLTLPTNREV